MADIQQGDEQTVELARQLTAIARILLAPGPVEDTLQQIVDLSVQAIDGCDEAGLCEADHTSTRSVPTSPLVAELDRWQTELDEGPCVDVLGGLDSVYVDDLAETDVWPQFRPLALAAGLHSALAYRLFAGSDTLGALQLYARQPAAFDSTGRAQGLIFAAHAGVALALATTHEADREKAEQLQVALVSREMIGQAQGILMERERITADQAFDLLRKASQRLNVKLRDVAQTLVDTGQAPEQDTPGGD